jgi:Flp pilus assembly pilin Flp
MFRRLAHLAETVLREERAQATVEYALVVSVTVALLVGISSVVLDGLSTYYNSITSIVCLPIP